MVVDQKKQLMEIYVTNRISVPCKYVSGGSKLAADGSSRKGKYQGDYAASSQVNPPTYQPRRILSEYCI